MQWLAPSSRARASFSGTTSTATSGQAEQAAAPSTAERPTPPSPNTATDSPGRTPAVFTTAPTPVITAQPNRAAMEGGRSGSMRTAERSDTTAYSANPDTP